ncbi:hypothetical protein ABT173_04480 [Streptomyces sp. NPDC001795]|uniref:hypothetical protein n=1 Tax=Streptomyces sp. NPDC001795 TaxID=3154525 RepID=UPI00331EBD7C
MAGHPGRQGPLSTLRLAVQWARAVPRAERTREWILAVEGLLSSVIEDEHTGHRALHAVAERAAAVEAQAAEPAEAGDVDATEVAIGATVVLARYAARG